MPAVPKKHRVLFLCTGNACRSQMAEGWARHLKGDCIEAYSAGTAPKGLDPLAVEAMAEVGVGIAGHTSKHIDDLADVRFDYVVTVCDRANESCPVWPGGVKRLHVGFEDPPALAGGAGSQADAMIHYRRVRDEIRAFVESLPDGLETRASRSG